LSTAEKIEDRVATFLPLLIGARAHSPKLIFDSDWSWNWRQITA